MLRRLLTMPAFRMAAIIATGYFTLTVFLALFIYWQVAIGEINRVDHVLERDAALLAEEPPEDLDKAVTERLAADFHRIVIAALFDSTGRPLLGNLRQIPPEIPLDGRAYPTSHPSSVPSEVLRMVARRLPDGRLLAIGRNVESLKALRLAVLRALAWGSAPGLLLSLVVGGIAGHRSQRQLEAMQAAVTSIINGNLQERLPSFTWGNGEFARLIDSVNRMLDEMVQGISDLECSSQNIAHDLRTYLTRVRLRLEQAYFGAKDYDEMRGLVDRAIAGLDQAMRVITALLRIGQINRGQIRLQFRDFIVGDALKEIVELYSSMAEAKEIVLTLQIIQSMTIHGDRDLFLEAVANLVDNAIKFTAPGGWVLVEALRRGGSPVIRVVDNGPGIATEERERVLQRYYRAPSKPTIPGSGLGLSLVDSIARLHGFRLLIDDVATGCAIELICG